MSDLRKTIADAIFNSEFNQKWQRIGPYAATQFADTIITTLRLRQQTIPPTQHLPQATRYTTDWTNHDR